MASPAAVALLRGINVGGRNKLAMAELRELMASLGHQNVSTYIQTGNVVFVPGPDPVASSPEAISDAIDDRFGLRLPVIVRAGSDLDGLASRNPFLAEGGAEPDLTKVHALFLSDDPTADAVASLDPQRSPIDEFVVSGAEMFIRYGGDVSRSKLDLAYIERCLGVRATARNWKTVLKLQDMVADAS